MVLVALFVRNDVLDHAICTIAVAPHPVVADNHHSHSLELVSVEAPVIEIAGVIAHAMHFQPSVFLSPPAGGGGGGSPGGSPGESGGLQEASGSSEKVNLGGDGELVS